MHDCIFCKIIEGDVPSTKVYEDERVYVFLDIAPNNPGHTLVIPKEHSEDSLTTPDDVLAALHIAAKRVGNALLSVVGAEGINIITNNKKAAGQVVFHTHIHVIPRYSDDGFQHWQGTPYSDATLRDDIQTKLSHALKGE